MEKNENGLIKTPYDGKEAMIIGNHPHEGASAICLGCDTTNAGPGLMFENKNTEERFFVFNPNNVAWKKI